MADGGREWDVFAAWERDSWEQRAHAYAASISDLTDGTVPALLDAVAADHGVWLLDIGTGPGSVAVTASARGATVRAVDQSRAMVAIARAAGVDAVQAEATALPFESATFGAAVASYVLNHLPEPEQAVAEWARVLTPGGRLAMTIWDRPEANPAIGTIGAMVGQLGLRADVPVGPDPYRYTDDAQVRRLLAAWSEVRTARVAWHVDVVPERWFDAIADATPRTGAVLAQASPADRDRARRLFAQRARELHGDAAETGLVRLPASAVLITARKPVVRPQSERPDA